MTVKSSNLPHGDFADDGVDPVIFSNWWEIKLENTFNVSLRD